MTKMRWATMGAMLLLAYVLQAFGCSSTPAATGSGGTGDCCACTITEPSCSRTRSFTPLVHVNDCESFCAGQQLGTCSGSLTASPTITAATVACTDGGQTPLGTGPAADGSTTTVSRDGGSMVGGGNLGAQCKSDTDCMGGSFTCLKPTDDILAGKAGGYPNGICTADCSADKSACTKFGGVCVNFDDPNAVNPKRICLESCTIGTPAKGVIKCHNRPDEECDDVSQTCQPLCATDADCGGRKCGALGMCTDTARAGNPLGSPCTTDKNSACAGGFCFALEASVQGGPPVPGICSALCVFGTIEACDWRRTPISGGLPVGVCFNTFSKSGGVGDIGFCIPVCDADADCPKTAGTRWVCDHTLKGFDATFNHGACLLDNTDGGAPPSTDAGGQ